MNEMRIKLNVTSKYLTPGQEVRGIVKWSLKSAPYVLQLRLLCIASTHSQREISLMKLWPINDPEQEGIRSIKFNMPEGPLSFHGNVFNLSWMLELVSARPDATGYVDLHLVEKEDVIDLRGMSPQAEGAA